MLNKNKKTVLLLSCVFYRCKAVCNPCKAIKSILSLLSICYLWLMRCAYTCCIKHDKINPFNEMVTFRTWKISLHKPLGTGWRNGTCQSSLKRAITSKLSLLFSCVRIGLRPMGSNGQCIHFPSSLR